MQTTGSSGVLAHSRTVQVALQGHLSKQAEICDKPFNAGSSAHEGRHKCMQQRRTHQCEVCLDLEGRLRRLLRLWSLRWWHSLIGLRLRRHGACAAVPGIRLLPCAC